MNQDEEIARLKAELEEAQLNLEAFRFSPAGAINDAWKPNHREKTWARWYAQGKVNALVVPGPGGCYWATYGGSVTLGCGGSKNPRDGMHVAEKDLKSRGLL